MSNMVGRKDSKLNQLQWLPESVLVDAGWLERHGYSRSLRSHYVKTGWLSQPAPRVYRRSRAPLDWKQVVVSLQYVLGYQLTVGGRSALDEQGYAHYLTHHAREVHLYGTERPPVWLQSLPLDVKFVWHNSDRLFPDALESVSPGIDAEKPNAGLPHDEDLAAYAHVASLSVRYSSPERAILELLDELPDHESFGQVDALMGGLSSLSPRRVKMLLEKCRSVKVKRLFFYFADRHPHAWLDKIDRQKIDLGSGKRRLVAGGRLDTRYNITVPKELDALS